MTNSKSSSRTNSSSKAATADLTLLFHEPTIDIANRLKTLLEIERKPQYQCHDFTLKLLQLLPPTTIVVILLVSTASHRICLVAVSTIRNR